MHWRRGFIAGVLLLVIAGGTTAARSTTPALTFLEAAAFALLFSIPLVVVALRSRRHPETSLDAGAGHPPTGC